MSASIQVTVRVSARLLRRTDELRAFVRDESGGEAARADVLRRAISLGIRELERRSARADKAQPEAVAEEGSDASPDSKES